MKSLDLILCSYHLFQDGTSYSNFNPITVPPKSWGFIKAFNGHLVAHEEITYKGQPVIVVGTSLVMEKEALDLVAVFNAGEEDLELSYEILDAAGVVFSEQEKAAITHCLELNRMFEKDREAIESIFSNRVPCNEDLANDPHCAVVTKEDGSYLVSALGVTNGIIGSMTPPPGGGVFLTMIFDDDGSFTGFGVLYLR